MEEIPLEYLLNSSKRSLEQFMLRKLDFSRHRQRQIEALMSEWVEATAAAIVAEWFRTNGEALMATAVAPPIEARTEEDSGSTAPSHEPAQSRAQLDIDRLTKFRFPNGIFRKRRAG